MYSWCFGHTGTFSRSFLPPGWCTKHIPLPSVVTWLAPHHHSGLVISATASGRPLQLCTFLISCTFPLKHLLQTVVTIYVDSCDCSVSFLPVNALSSTKEGLNLFRSALRTHQRGPGYSINICWVKKLEWTSVKFSCSVMSDSVVTWTAACQASLSITNSQSLLQLMSTASVMPYNHLILCHPLLLPPSIFPSIRVCSNESVLHIRWPKY